MKKEFDGMRWWQVIKGFDKSDLRGVFSIDPNSKGGKTNRKIGYPFFPKRGYRLEYKIRKI